MATAHCRPSSGGPRGQTSLRDNNRSVSTFQRAAEGPATRSNSLPGRSVPRVSLPLRVAAGSSSYTISSRSVNAKGADPPPMTARDVSPLTPHKARSSSPLTPNTTRPGTGTSTPLRPSGLGLSTSPHPRLGLSLPTTAGGRFRPIGGSHTARSVQRGQSQTERASKQISSQELEASNRDSQKNQVAADVNARIHHMISKVAQDVHENYVNTTARAFNALRADDAVQTAIEAVRQERDERSKQQPSSNFKPGAQAFSSLRADDTIQTALEAVRQERDERSKEIAEIKAKMHLQQERFTQELFRCGAMAGPSPTSAKSATNQEELMALVRDARERVARLEVQVQTKIGQQNDSLPQEVMEQSRTVIAAHLQESLHSPSFNSLLQDVVIDSPIVSQAIQRLLDDLVGSFLHAQGVIQVQAVSQELQKTALELGAESRQRARADQDLHSRLGRELFSIRSRLEGLVSDFQGALAEDRRMHVDEVAELKALLDSIWNKLQRRRSESIKQNIKNDRSPTSQHGSASSLPTSCDGAESDASDGDIEEIGCSALYQMVQETLGTSVMIKSELQELKAHREKDVARVYLLERHYLALASAVHRGVQHPLEHVDNVLRANDDS